MLITVILCFFSSCEKDPEPLTTNSAITGRVYVHDATYGDLPRVNIVASGPYGSLSTVTDKDGVFWFKNVGNGTYMLECSLQNYGTIKHYGVQVYGNDTAYMQFETLYPMPHETLKAPDMINVQVDAENYIVVSTSLSNCQVNFLPVRFFLSTDSEVSFDNFQGTIQATNNWECNYRFSDGYMYYINFVPIQSGQKVYITSYICHEWDQGYLDTYNNKLVFSSLVKKSKSNTLSFIMPGK